MTNTTKVITGKVRFSYAHVWEPDSIDGGDPKFSVALLISKKDKKTLDKIKAAINTAIEDGTQKLAATGGKVNKATLKLPLRDGDEERPDSPEYADCYFVNASSKNRPGIVDAALQKIIDRSEFYSGCYGHASVNFYAFNTKGNKGIACGLNNLQKTADGESLSGGSTPEDDFEAEETDDEYDDLLG